MSLYGVIGYHVTLSQGHMIANQPIYRVIGYHVILSDGHMIANQPIYGGDCGGDSPTSPSVVILLWYAFEPHLLKWI